MDFVIKIGGSLCKYPIELKGLCRKLSEWLKGKRCIVTPGGGPFTDIVRQVQKVYALSDDVAHEMALLAVDQYGLMLSELISGSVPVKTLAEAKRLLSLVIPVLLPSYVVTSLDMLERSWNAGSDCIAAMVAKACSAKKLILVKDVDGIHDPYDPARILTEVFLDELEGARACLDKLLPQVLRGSGVECVIVNGTKHERVKAVIEGSETTCTKILPN